MPELADVPLDALFEPWKLPPKQRGGYPDPMVDHQFERRRAIAAHRDAVQAARTH